MKDLRQAAQQALEALDEFSEISDFTPALAVHAMKALRAALAEHDRLAGIEAIEKHAGIHVSQQAEPDSDYERGFVDGMNLQTKGSVDKAVNRIAEPEQEPVDSPEKAGAYMDARLWEFIDMAAAWPETRPDSRTWDHVMVYAPTPRKPLTDEEIAQIVGECAASAYRHDDFSFARAIEKAHGIGEQT